MKMICGLKNVLPSSSEASQSIAGVIDRRHGVANRNFRLLGRCGTDYRSGAGDVYDAADNNAS